MAMEKKSHPFDSCFTIASVYKESFSNTLINSEIELGKQHRGWSVLGDLVASGVTDGAHIAITTREYRCFPDAGSVSYPYMNEEYYLDKNGRTWHWIDGGNG